MEVIKATQAELCLTKEPEALPVDNNVIHGLDGPVLVLKIPYRSLHDLCFRPPGIKKIDFKR